MSTLTQMAAAVTGLLRDEVGAPIEHAQQTPEFEFAEALVFDDLVPFELSPLGAQSLAGVVLKGGGVAAGAAVGLVAGGPTPLLLVTVPAGMILCGAAAGIARALEEGLRTRLLRRLGAEQGQSTSAGATR